MKMRVIKLIFLKQLHNEFKDFDGIIKEYINQYFLYLFDINIF